MTVIRHFAYQQIAIRAALLSFQTYAYVFIKILYF